MRYFPLTLALLAAPLLTSLAPAADNPPNFTGTWQLDKAKSQADHNQDITLDITFNNQDASNTLTFVRHVRENDGKEIVSRFSCPVNGSQCEFDEGNHKAKGSAWRDDSKVFVLMSAGPRNDSSAEWQLELTPDGNTLDVQYTVFGAHDKTEKHVFTKAS